MDSVNLAAAPSLSSLSVWPTNIPQRFRRAVSSGAYRPEIDGLRFFAIANVVLGHLVQRAYRFFPNFRDAIDSNPLASSLHLVPGIGIYLFFAISGFIIASQARRAHLSPLSPGFLRTYFGRRVLRIEPPYIVLLVATWLILTLTGYQPEGTNQFFTEPQSLSLSLFASVFYLHDLVWGTFPRLFPPGWTLEVEVQFYLLAPLVFWLWFRLERLWLRLVLAGAVWFGANVLSTWMPHQIGSVSVGYSLLRCFAFFWLGIILADLRVWLDKGAFGLSPAHLTILGWLGLLGFTAFPDFLGADASFVGLAARCVTGLLVATMFAGALGPDSGFRRFCSRPWISLIGGACYSLYLVHIQLIQMMSVIAAKHWLQLSFAGVLLMMTLQIAIVIVAGLGFYVCIERPFMRPNWPALGAQRVKNAIHALRLGFAPAAADLP